MTKIKTWWIDDVKNTVGTFAWDDKGRHVIGGYAGDSLKIGVPITKQMIKDKTFPAGVKP
jgi:hypothetical protein